MFDAEDDSRGAVINRVQSTTTNGNDYSVVKHRNGSIVNMRRCPELGHLKVRLHRLLFV